MDCFEVAHEVKGFFIMNVLVFAVKYNEDITSLNDRYMHLTNYSINRLSKNYTPNEDFAACEGHKW